MTFCTPERRCLRIWTAVVEEAIMAADTKLVCYEKWVDLRQGSCAQKSLGDGLLAYRLKWGRENTKGSVWTSSVAFIAVNELYCTAVSYSGIFRPLDSTGQWSYGQVVHHWQSYGDIAVCKHLVPEPTKTVHHFHMYIPESMPIVSCHCHRLTCLLLYIYIYIYIYIYVY